MGFESNGPDTWHGRSPGGFEFGVQGWSYGPPIPKSITFFLDNTALVADQYGRNIRCAVTSSGAELRFADSPPVADQSGVIVPRPQFATHVQVIAALAEERIDWLAYEVRYRTKDGNIRVRGGLTLTDATKLQTKMIQDGNILVAMDRTISCAGWPQLPYEELKRLPELPPTPISELERILDPRLRAAAVRAFEEAAGSRGKTSHLVAVEK